MAFEIHALNKKIIASLKVAESFESLSKLFNSKTTEQVLSEGVIGTHSGTFHCDEALACGLLKILPRFRMFNILRSRDQKLIEKCQVVVDVGAVYNEAALRFDHHQSTFSTKFSDDRKTKLSSAGLVYKHFGKEIIKEVAVFNSVDLSEDILNNLYKTVYFGFIEEIDGVDNGVNNRTGENNYTMGTHLSARVGKLNPRWNDPIYDLPKVDQEKEISAAFIRAVTLTTNEFIGYVQGLINTWLPAREIVLRAIETRFDIDESGEIIKLEKYAPFKTHLFEIERERNLEGKIKYVIAKRQDGAWSVQCVSVEGGGFQNRKSIPKKYCGLRDEELSSVIGIKDCVFVHAAGFIGANKTYEGALEMAKISLRN
eukprot:snap_masked-scaffold_11-processed-gene-12.26-mRNA-1 protein AED:0.01 eAED:0.01 QI:0/-1/0/1/-1/1/1/0/369